MKPQTILDGAEQRNLVYSDDRFSRRTGEIELGDTKLEIQRDILERGSIENCFCRCDVTDLNDGTIELEGFSRYDSGPGFVDSADKPNVWIPLVPIARKYATDGHLTNERGLDSEPTESGMRFVLDTQADVETVEFSVVVLGEEDIPSTTSTASPWETETVIKGNWFDYEGLWSFWSYYVNGQIYDPRDKGTGRWPCQQCAHTWFLHLLDLGELSGENIYTELAEIVAYSVALSLPESGRWRHGVWTEDAETHARFQTDGIHLLVTGYEQFGVKFFLEAATRATDYLLSISDSFSDGGLWFAHDSLEKSEDQHKKHYRFRPKTRVFGKSPSNTVCLNTHIWTMVALERLSEHSEQDQYKEAFDRGETALKRVLSLDSLSGVYWLVNQVFDKVKYAAWSFSPLTVLNKRASQGCIMLLKTLFPRVVMPGGRVERDVSHTVRSDFYHLQNLKDLAVLSTYLDDEFVHDIVCDGIEFVTRWDVVGSMLPADRRAVTILDILLIVMAQSSKDYTEEVQRQLTALEEAGVSLSADIVSFSPVLEDSVAKTYNDLSDDLFSEAMARSEY